MSESAETTLKTKNFIPLIRSTKSQLTRRLAGSRSPTGESRIVRKVEENSKIAATPREP